jgi:hypothetical protein
MQPSSNYQTFLQGKRQFAHTVGIEVALDALHPTLFPFQRTLVQWALRKGRAALFADCGLGKSFMQLEWANQVHLHTGRDVLILAPLAVSSQTISEGVKLGITVHACREQSDVRPGLSIANYEILDHFDASHFGGVVLDESSILKSFMGQTKRALVESFADTPYRLCCSATPAPNDNMEIGNHSEFLGVMPSTEMMMRWFINDTMKSGHYRLKGHAVKDFWAWVTSWAVSIRRPSDLGFSDEGYVLPELHLHHHYVETDVTKDAEEGQLFRAPMMSATNLHKEMRITAPDRAQAVASLVNESCESWTVWCHTNYEADALVALIPDAVEVRGGEKAEVKERKLMAFTNGEARVIITKPSIAGYGLNWQHCRNAAFVGLSYSYEDFYQAVRRLYRFGQKQPVDVHVIAADTEGTLVTTLERKMRAHMQMTHAMNTSALTTTPDLHLSTYNPKLPMILPTWLVSQQKEQGAA